MRSLALLASLLAPASILVAQQSDSTRPHADSAFQALQARGKTAMGVDQSTSAHRFESLPDGGRIELQREVDDSAGVSRIRRHLKEIVVAFTAGDFRLPAMVHAMKVPGTDIMAARRDAIRYEFHQLPRGGEVRILTSDPEAVRAVHEFLAFQRLDHRTGEAQHHQH